MQKLTPQYKKPTNKPTYINPLNENQNETRKKKKIAAHVIEEFEGYMILTSLQRK